ncbi:MAG: D-tyrosyl-tRNA(Tyr) deacylase [Clostridiales Family XIII bacterium]|jgi:D-tyrosyl-tRNA(Tyr) deacylase|nr:D-tyrosyl-tRNA(Tyr) deacylase [Clostridiales Family XIII bacterium]
MRAVVQRVREARVTVGETLAGAIGPGLLAFIGVEEGDDARDANHIADKIAGLRVFEDADGKMNLSVAETGGAVLVVSQFTLLGDVRKGKRPSFAAAARPALAEPLCRACADRLRAAGLHVEEGVFRAEMLVGICNDGPVTLLIDSRKRF